VEAGANAQANAQLGIARLMQSPRHIALMQVVCLFATQDAFFFVWTYPVEGAWSSDMYELAHDTPELSLLLYGGFLYLGKDKAKVVVTNAVVGKMNVVVRNRGSAQMGFKINTTEVKWEDVRDLSKTKTGPSIEFEPVTIRALNRAGAKAFCWVPPKMMIGSYECKHGGFA